LNRRILIGISAKQEVGAKLFTFNEITFARYEILFLNLKIINSIFIDKIRVEGYFLRKNPLLFKSLSNILNIVFFIVKTLIPGDTSLQDFSYRTK